MKRTAVLDVVGLSERLMGENTPFLTRWASKGKKAYITPTLPAVTCTSQSCFLTGAWPTTHGIVGNGWYFRDECEIRFWRQSNNLVTAPKIWETAKQLDPDFTCANLFWWYNMYSSADYSVTPRPMYPADGRKIPDSYSQPPQLKDSLQAKLGAFPLFDFWGPKTSIKSSQWIADAAKEVEQEYSPTLSLVYLPHLDYNLQRKGPNDPTVAVDLKEIDDVCADLIAFYRQRGIRVIVLSEYGITAVDQPVSLNRVLREAGYIQVRTELGLELLDPGASKAFAVADHQLAHVYVNDKDEISNVRHLIENTPGVEAVLGEEEKETHHLDHPRSGELVALAESNAWFTYYYWLEDDKAPDFARTVDIHRKPGYDPVDLFLDPKISAVRLKVLWKLLKKTLGFRTLLDVIPLDPSLVNGSHGRYPDSKGDGPILITDAPQHLDTDRLQAIDVHRVIQNHLS